MARQPPRLEPGQITRRQAAEWNAWAAEVSRMVAGLRTGPGLNSVQDSTGLTVLRGQNAEFWAQITGSSTNGAYPFQSMLWDSGSQKWVAIAGGLKGTATLGPANEVNKSTSVPLNSIVRVYNGPPAGQFWFTTGGGAADDWKEVSVTDFNGQLDFSGPYAVMKDWIQPGASTTLTEANSNIGDVQLLVQSTKLMPTIYPFYVLVNGVDAYAVASTTPSDLIIPTGLVNGYSAGTIVLYSPLITALAIQATIGDLFLTVTDASQFTPNQTGPFPLTITVNGTDAYIVTSIVGNIFNLVTPVIADYPVGTSVYIPTPITGGRTVYLLNFSQFVSSDSAVILVGIVPRPIAGAACQLIVLVNNSGIPTTSSNAANPTAIFLAQTGTFGNIKSQNGFYFGDTPIGSPNIVDPQGLPFYQGPGIWLYPGESIELISFAPTSIPPSSGQGASWSLMQTIDHRVKTDYLDYAPGHLVNKLLADQHMGIAPPVVSITNKDTSITNFDPTYQGPLGEVAAFDILDATDTQPGVVNLQQQNLGLGDKIITGDVIATNDVIAQGQGPGGAQGATFVDHAGAVRAQRTTLITIPVTGSGYLFAWLVHDGDPGQYQPPNNWNQVTSGNNGNCFYSLWQLVGGNFNQQNQEWDWVNTVDSVIIYFDILGTTNSILVNPVENAQADNTPTTAAINTPQATAYILGLVAQLGGAGGVTFSPPIGSNFTLISSLTSNPVAGNSVGAAVLGQLETVIGNFATSIHSNVANNWATVILAIDVPPNASNLASGGKFLSGPGGYWQAGPAGNVLGNKSKIANASSLIASAVGNAHGAGPGYVLDVVAGNFYVFGNQSGVGGVPAYGIIQPTGQSFLGQSATMVDGTGFVGGIMVQGGKMTTIPGGLPPLVQGQKKDSNGDTDSPAFVSLLAALVQLGLIRDITT